MADKDTITATVKPTSNLRNAVDAWCAAAHQAGVTATPVDSAHYGGGVVLDGDPLPWEVAVTDDGVARLHGRWQAHLKFYSGDRLLADSAQIIGDPVLDYAEDTLIVRALSGGRLMPRRITAEDLGVEDGTSVRVVAQYITYPVADDGDEISLAEEWWATAGDMEEWSTQEVASFLSHARGRACSARYADVWLRRGNLPVIGRRPGRTGPGQNLYDAELVQYAWKQRPGQGARTDRPS